MAKLKENIGTIAATLAICVVISIVCNMVGYGKTIMESIPGLVILGLISLAGYILSYVVPIKKMSAVLWISFIAIFLALPISPVSEAVIYHVNNIALMAVVTPILAYAGVLVGKDWAAFKKVGIVGIIVSVFVIAGTFLISSMLGDFFIKIFN